MTVEQKQAAPIMEMATEMNLGKVVAGKSHKFVLPVKNNGVNALEVRRVYSADKAINAKAPKAIKSGKKGAITLDINAKDLQPGAYSRQILVITNDYEHSQQKVTVNFTVE